MVNNNFKIDNLINGLDLETNIVKRIKEAELYSKRFGTFAKSDYEVLMFTAFLDSLRKPARDYEISIALGITESKVRNLRVKSQLLYPKELEWVTELAKSIQHGYYDKASGQITVTFEDPSVQSLMKNTIEESFGTVGKSLNVKQLILPVESFLLLAASAEEDEKLVLERLNEAFQKESTTQDSIEKIEKRNFKSRFIKGIPNMVSFIEALTTIYTIGKPIINAVVQIMG